jgi:hypothetical protein
MSTATTNPPQSEPGFLQRTSPTAAVAVAEQRVRGEAPKRAPR